MAQNAAHTERTKMPTPCGHSTHGNGFVFTCDLAANHKGLHRQRTQLLRSVSVTNWGDDGLAPHATKYPDNGSYRRLQKR